MAAIGCSASNANEFAEAPDAASLYRRRLDPGVETHAYHDHLLRLDPRVELAS